jgi:hypothetical protein
VRHIVRTAPLLLTCAILLGSAAALADPPPPRPRFFFRFKYTREPGAQTCPTDLTVHDLVRGEYGYDPVKPDAGPGIQIDVSKQGAVFHAEITIEAEPGKLAWVQEMNEPPRGRCMTLMRSAVLGAIMTAELLLRKPYLVPPPAPPAPPPAPPSPPPPAPAPPRTAAPPAPSAPSPPKWTWRLGAGPLVSGWLAPGVSMGGFVFVTRSWDEYSITAEARGTGSIVPGLETGPEVYRTLRGRFLGGALVPCYQPGFFFACGALNFGLLQASLGEAEEDLVKTQHPFVFAIGARSGIEWPFTNRLALRGFAELAGIVTARPFVEDRRDVEVWKAPPAHVSIGLALTAEW